MPGASTHAPPGIIDKHAENLKALGEAETTAEDEHHVSEGENESETDKGSEAKKRRNTQEGPATLKRRKDGKAEDKLVEKPDKPQRKPLDLAVRVAWKTKTRLQHAWACADSLSQEMSHFSKDSHFIKCARRPTANLKHAGVSLFATSTETLRGGEMTWSMSLFGPSYVA